MQESIKNSLKQVHASGERLLRAADYFTADCCWGGGWLERAGEGGGGEGGGRTVHLKQTTTHRGSGKTFENYREKMI